jgi:callose synthase
MLSHASFYPFLLLTFFSRYDSILESSHGGSYRKPEGTTTWDQEYQLFQPAGAIKFPLQVTDAWLEKVLKQWLRLTSAMDIIVV